MKEFLDFLYNNDYPNSVKIQFDNDFGSESEVKELIYKLQSSKIIIKTDLRYSEIIAIIDKSELYKLIYEFDYDLDNYDMSKKSVVNNMIIKGGIKNSIVVQGSRSRLGDLKNNDSVDALAATDNDKSMQKSKIDIKVILQYMAWTGTILGAILAYFRFFKGQ